MIKIESSLNFRLRPLILHAPGKLLRNEYSTIVRILTLVLRLTRLMIPIVGFISLRIYNKVSSIIFNNFTLFINSSLHLILCGDGVYICESCPQKIKKIYVPCHEVADKLLVAWSPRALWQ